MSEKKSAKYMSPYLAGFGLGLVLLGAFFIAGRGLGASGAMMRCVVSVEKTIAPNHVNQNIYLSKYGGGEKNPLRNWLIFEVLGILIGGLSSGLLTRRVQVETGKGPRISNQQRWGFALLGGIFFGFGARMARGCTSGVALSGGATLVVGSWVTMLAIFAGAYGLAFFVRKLWI